jgi:hypothetical protein
LITAYTLLELVSGKVLHELCENGLANVHYSLSRAHRPSYNVLNSTPENREKAQIEKSKPARNLLT